MNYYKLAQTDGWDFYSGNSINYRKNIGKTISIRDMGRYELCTCSVIHASKNPNDCFVGAKIPCSAYLVSGKPVVDTEKKSGFISLKVIREIKNLDKLFGWNYAKAINPINPFKIIPPKITKKEIELLKKWINVSDSISGSISNSISNSVSDSISDSISGSVSNSVFDSISDSISDSLFNSIYDSIYAYIGSLFPTIKIWKYIKHKSGEYPFQPAVALWKKGLIASFDGKIWRLHGEEKATILYEWKPQHVNS